MYCVVLYYIVEPNDGFWGGDWVQMNLFTVIGVASFWQRIYCLILTVK